MLQHRIHHGFRKIDVRDPRPASRGGRILLEHNARKLPAPHPLDQIIAHLRPVERDNVERKRVQEYRPLSSKNGNERRLRHNWACACGYRLGELTPFFGARASDTLVDHPRDPRGVLSRGPGASPTVARTHGRAAGPCEFRNGRKDDDGRNIHINYLTRRESFLDS